MTSLTVHLSRSQLSSVLLFIKETVTGHVRAGPLCTRRYSGLHCSVGSPLRALHKSWPPSRPGQVSTVSTGATLSSGFPFHWRAAWLSTRLQDDLRGAWPHSQTSWLSKIRGELGDSLSKYIDTLAEYFFVLWSDHQMFILAYTSVFSNCGTQLLSDGTQGPLQF